MWAYRAHIAKTSVREAVRFSARLETASVSHSKRMCKETRQVYLSGACHGVRMWEHLKLHKIALDPVKSTEDEKQFFWRLYTLFILHVVQILH